MRRLFIALWLVGCGGGDMPPDGAPADASTIIDGSPDASPADTCAFDREQWRAVVAGLSRDCDTDPDCIAVGQPPAPCEGYPSIAAECGGVVVNAAAYAASTAPALEQDFSTAMCSCEGACIADCSRNLARCMGGTCTAVNDMCGCNPPPGTCP